MPGACPTIFVKLALARRAAAERQLRNVEFTALDVRDWNEPGGYDVVYSRFLLQHLSEPGSLLRRMWAVAAGIPHPQVRLVQTVHHGEGKILAWSTLEATAEAVIAEGLAAKDQITAALASLRQFSDDPDTLICGPRVFQLWACR